MPTREDPQPPPAWRAVILTALPVEYQAVRAHLTNLREEVHQEGTVYERGLFTSEDGVWDTLLVETGPNNQRATLEAERAIQYFKPDTALFVGVAGGLKDLSIGDVVAAHKVYGYESGKDRTKFEPRPDVGESSYALEQRARAVARKADWLRRIPGPPPASTPRALVAPIAAGEKVIADTRSSLHQFLRKQYGDAVAVEMEGRGFLTATRANRRVDALVIRGISDRIDAKAEADASGSQEQASRHASSFAFEVLAHFQPSGGGTSLPQPAPEGREPVWTVPYPRTAGFTGRSDLLQAIREHFVSASARPMPQALFGLGGIGKTRLAVEYAALHAFNEPHYSHVLWIRADTPSVLASDHAALVEVLGLPERVEAEQAPKIAAVLRWLQRHDGWLLVFDNAEQPEVLRPYLPPSYRGHVLITSRNPAWGELAVARPVEELSVEESSSLLRQRTRQNDEAAAAKLAEALGHLPLALVQAAAYIEQAGKSLADYLTLFEQRRRELLARQPVPADYPSTVAATWELSFEQIRTQCPAGADLLALCSLLAPSPIPIDILKAGTEVFPAPLAEAFSDDLRRDDAIAILRRYSLVQVTGRMLVFHRLVQAVMMDRLPTDERKRWAEQALRLIQHVFHFHTEEVRTWDWCAFLLPHALAVSTRAWALGVRVEALSALLESIGRFWKEQAEYEPARDIAAWALEALQASPSPPPFAESSILQLQGVVSLGLGKLHEARELLERALARLREAPDAGLKTALDAAILNSLALVLYDLGSFSEAAEKAGQALALEEKDPARNPSSISMTCSNLAIILTRQARFEEARAHLERALAMTRANLGPHHPRLALHLNNLGDLLRELGRYSEAREQFFQALEIVEATYGPSHPHTAVVLRNLGDVHQQLEDLTHARAFCERALRIDEECFGPDHKDVAIDLNNLALALHGQGELNQARACLARAISIEERAYGPDYSNLATTLDNLGRIYEELGDTVAARASFERALRIHERTFGPDHPDVANVLNNLGLLLARSLGDAVQAQRHLERALAIDEKAYGPHHLEVATDLLNLASILSMQSEQTQPRTLDLLQRALAIYTSHPSRPSSQLLKTLLDLSYLHIQRREWGEARRHLDHAFQVQSSLGVQDLTIVNILVLRGDISFAERQYPLAQKEWEQALTLAETQMKGEAHLLAPLVSKLARVSEEMGDIPRTRAQLERAIELQDQDPSPNLRSLIQDLMSLAGIVSRLGGAEQSLGHVDRARAMCRSASEAETSFLPEILLLRGRLCCELERWEEARASLEEGLRLSPFPSSLKWQATVHEFLSLALLSLGHARQAQRHMEKALALKGRIVGTDHPEYALGLISLASILEQSGKPQDVQKRLKRALDILERQDAPRHSPSHAGSGSSWGCPRDLGPAEPARQALGLRQAASACTATG